MKAMEPQWFNKADKIIWENGYDQGMLHASNLIHKHLHNTTPENVEGRMLLMWKEFEKMRHGMKFPSDPKKGESNEDD